MRLKVFIVMLLLVSTLSPIKAEPLVEIRALNHEFSALPGDTLVIPFNVTNVGNDTVFNVTVYLSGPSEGFLYQTKVIRDPIPPGKSFSDVLILKVLNAEPGLYNLKLIARVGDLYSEDEIRVRVKTLIDFELNVEAKDRYIYGKGGTVLLEVRSNSNGILTGRVGYVLSNGSEALINFTTVTYVTPEGSWNGEIPVEGLPPGRYTVKLWANFSGVYKETRKVFEVYQRNLTYTAFYRGGVIKVQVTEDGKGVEGIEVYVNGVHFTTDERGVVEYPVTRAGEYTIKLNLDGKIVETTIEVKELSVEVGQIGEILWIGVKEGTVPVPNVTVVVSGPLGKAYGVTNESGVVIVNLTKTGYGTLIVRAESERYLSGQATIKTVPPETETKSVTITPEPTSTTSHSPVPITTVPETPTTNRGPIAIVLILSGLLLAVSSYLAFLRPIVTEDILDGYYFIKVKAPRLRELRDFRVERKVNAVNARATKGRVELEDGKLVWELDLEPGEEAYLQVFLG